MWDTSYVGEWSCFLIRPLRGHSGLPTCFLISLRAKCHGYGLGLEELDLFCRLLLLLFDTLKFFFLILSPYVFPPRRRPTSKVQGEYQAIHILRVCGPLRALTPLRPLHICLPGLETYTDGVIVWIGFIGLRPPPLPTSSCPRPFESQSHLMKTLVSSSEL